MKISDKGIEFIKQHEGMRLKAYQDSVGVWTIGVGSTHDVHPGMVISEAECEARLRKDLEWVEECINRLVKAHLTQPQVNALGSFVFNLGCRAFQKSTLLRKLNAEDYEGAAEELMRWVNAGGHKLAGLVRRRHDEMEMFLS